MSEDKNLFDNRPDVFGIASALGEPNYRQTRAVGATISRSERLYLSAIRYLLEENAALKKDLQDRVPKHRPGKDHAKLKNRISDLGWSEKEALEVRNSLGSFEVLWDAPGMEDYDDL